MSQFGVPDSNDNVLEEGNKLISILGSETRLVDAFLSERRTDSVNISPSGTGRGTFTFWYSN